MNFELELKKLNIFSIYIFSLHFCINNIDILFLYIYFSSVLMTKHNFKKWDK